MKLLMTAVFCSLPALAVAQLGPQPIPPGNPITPQKTLLGKTLFWEEQLSSTRTVACGTCHIPSAGMSDPRSALPGARVNPGPDGLFGTVDDKVGSPGVIHCLLNGSYLRHTDFRLLEKVGTRKAPTTINTGYLTNLFWDGRVDTDNFADPVTGASVLGSNATLENLIIQPPTNSLEMAHEGRVWTEVVSRVQQSRPLALAESLTPDLATFINNRGYPELFNDAFGSTAIDAPRIIQAIATYLRSLVSDQSPFDDFLNGDSGALTPNQTAGFITFSRTCTRCHVLPLLTDDDFHNTGVRPPVEDLGRGGVTGNSSEDAMFRTPSLRNVGLREPLFHHGQMAQLEGVVRFYNRGGDFPQDPFSDPLVDPLGLSQNDRRDLVDFLRNGLTDPRVAAESPPFDRPVLYTESSRFPHSVAAGTAGSGGFVPTMVAIEPPFIGNPNLTLGIDHALGGAPALFFATVTAQAVTIPILLPFGTLSGAGPGDGWGSLRLGIPQNPGLLGVQMDARWFVQDPGAFRNLAASEIFHFEFF